jgi:putative sigma-54 modulation protein
MDVRVHARHGPVPEDVQSYAVEKMGRLSKYLGTIDSIDVEFREEGNPRTGGLHVVHISVATTGPVFRCRVSAADPKAAIDTASSRLARRLREFKRRRQGKPPHAGPAHHPLADVPIPEPETEE